VQRSAETERVVNQFDTAEQASRYSNEFNTHRQQRSKRALVQALAGLQPGARILDMPCGSGRLLPLILDLGYQYTGADVSGHMVDAARAKFESLARTSSTPLEAAFDVEDIMSLSYADDEFDAVIVNRLFHHYTQAQTRVAALTELNRISRGPIIVFFLNTWTVRGLHFHLKHSLDRPKQRTPITRKEFRANGRVAGLTLTDFYPTRGRFNKEWYARFERSP